MADKPEIVPMDLALLTKVLEQLNAISAGCSVDARDSVAQQAANLVRLASNPLVSANPDWTWDRD